MFSTVPVITEAGMTLLLRAAGGEKITLTKFQIGSGTLPAGKDPKTVTALYHVEISNIGITKVEDTEDDGYIMLQGSFDNQSHVQHDFRWTELGLIAKDENNVEYLYAYANDGDNAGTLKAANSDVVTEQTLSVIVAIGRSENVTAYILPNATYASKAEFDEHVNARNPHGMAKSDIGLGNVPNVTTNNQQPTWTIAAKLQELVSGEYLSVAFGKIAKAIKDLIAHINDRNNPHGTTYRHVGAAAASHQHSASDITSGTLPVARGGTDCSSNASLITKFGDLLKDIFAAKQHTHNATEDIAGVVPIEHGGTGTNSSEGLTSLIDGMGFSRIPPHFGTYTGDGASSRVIDLGYQPSIVIYCDETGCFADDIKGTAGGMFFRDHPQYVWDYGYSSVAKSNSIKVAEVVSNGFKIYDNGSNGHTGRRPNKKDIVYFYIAF